jgi:hypothetical protein
MPSAFDGYEPNDYSHLGEDGDQSGSHAGYLRHKDNHSVAPVSPSQPSTSTVKVADNAPMHVREGIFSPWKEHFAWWPVLSEQGDRIWLRHTWRRRFYAAVWFDPAPWDGWYEYSDVRLSKWEHRP